MFIKKFCFSFILYSILLYFFFDLRRRSSLRSCRGSCIIGFGLSSCLCLRSRLIVADTVADILANELRATLANACAAGATTSSGPDDPPGFSVDARPRLQGCWRSVPRRTLTQSSALLGYIPVQLELGYRLRKALGRDHELCKRVATAFVACEPRCLDHLEACHVALS